MNAADYAGSGFEDFSIETGGDIPSYGWTNNKYTILVSRKADDPAWDTLPDENTQDFEISVSRNDTDVWGDVANITLHKPQLPGFLYFVLDMLKAWCVAH